MGHHSRKQRTKVGGFIQHKEPRCNRRYTSRFVHRKPESSKMHEYRSLHTTNPYWPEARPARRHYSQALPSWEVVASDVPDHERLLALSTSLAGTLSGFRFVHRQKKAEFHAADWYWQTFEVMFNHRFIPGCSCLVGCVVVQWKFLIFLAITFSIQRADIHPAWAVHIHHSAATGDQNVDDPPKLFQNPWPWKWTWLSCCN